MKKAGAIGLAAALVVGFACGGASSAAAQPANPWLPKHWTDQADDAINVVVSQKQNTNVARNLILVIGDGMGISTSTAARILKGQQEGKLGEEGLLAWEEFPHVALSKTYNTDAMTADSAGTATAYHYGFKTKFGVIGTDDRVIRGNCSTEGVASSSGVKNLLELAELAGKSSGIVTTARITHASPAPLYAKSAHRDWEADSDLPEAAVQSKCKDIAQQLIENGLGIEVVMGGGRSKFMPNTSADPEYPKKAGNRKDGRNLIEEWQQRQAALRKNCVYVWNQTGFDSVGGNTDCVLALFEPSHMKYEEEKRAEANSNEPSLTEMVEKAIKILSKNRNGFYLFIEGGKIDHGHHNSLARIALTETIEMHRAVKMAQNMTNPDDTLIVVSADHSHVFNIAGYPRRGTPILGLVENAEPEFGNNANDGKPYTVLVYGNGPGHKEPRENLTGIDTANASYVYQSAVPLRSESHGGEDVAVYATGPMSHLFHGVQEQTYIPRAMAYAACLGPNTKHCGNASSTSGTASRRTAALTQASAHFLASLAVFRLTLSD